MVILIFFNVYFTFGRQYTEAYFGKRGAYIKSA